MSDWPLNAAGRPTRPDIANLVCETGLPEPHRSSVSIRGKDYYADERLLIAAMSNNRNSELAWNYHNTTKHSYASIRTNAHSLDFADQPLPFKIYATIDPLPLPRDVRQTGVAALSAIAGGVPAHTEAAPDLEAVAQLLYLSAGITRHRKYPGGEIYFRAAACTGALYEVELYLVCDDLNGLPAGIYHFGAAEFGLRLLRAAWDRVLHLGAPSRNQ